MPSDNTRDETCGDKHTFPRNKLARVNTAHVVCHLMKDHSGSHEAIRGRTAFSWHNEAEPPDKTPLQIVEGILENALETDYGFEDGDEYSYIKSDTAETIIEALRDAGFLKEASHAD